MSYTQFIARQIRGKLKEISGIKCDDSGFLKDLIEETREYVNSNNIQREDDGWSFPVKQRVATKL